jgi:hypothetical protein
MRSDGPTVPNLGWHDAGAGAAPGAPSEREAHTWPTGDERPQQGVRGPDRWPHGYVSALALGASLCANVVLLLALLALLALLLLGHVGLGAASGPVGSAAAGTALSSPTTAAASPTPLSGWLKVTPSSVQVGCTDAQKTQFVVLENTGPQRVQWQATVAGAVGQAGQVGVALSPDHGDLDAGASLPIQVQNTTHASGSQGSTSQQGVIHFAATSADAGAAPGLSYTAVGCP